MKRGLVRLVALVTFLTGLLNLLALVWPLSLAGAFLSVPVLDAWRLLRLLVGLALVVSAVNVYWRRRLAYYLVLGLALIALLVQVGARASWPEVVPTFLLILLLFATRHLYTARTGRPDAAARRCAQRHHGLSIHQAL